MIFQYNGQILAAIVKLQGHAVSLVVLAIVAVLALLHDVVDIMFGGAPVVQKNGELVTRVAKDGSEYFVREPSLLKELMGAVIGGTVKRDENGHPVTDDFGNHLKNPGIASAMMVKFQGNLDNVTKRDI